MAEKALPHEWPQPLESSVSPRDRGMTLIRRISAKKRTESSCGLGWFPVGLGLLRGKFLSSLHLVSSWKAGFISSSRHLSPASPSQVLQVSLPSTAVSSCSAVLLAHFHCSCYLGVSLMSFLSRVADCVCPFFLFLLLLPHLSTGPLPSSSFGPSSCVYKVRVLFVACVSFVRGKN